VTEAQLRIAGGRVRCGACLSVFTGVDNLVAGAGPRLRPGESADSALDALLDELRNESPPRAPVKPEKAAPIPAALAAPKATLAAKPKAVPEPVPESVPESVPEALPEPEVDAEAAPGDVIDGADEEIEIADEALDSSDDELAVADESSDVAAEEIDLVPAAAPPEPVAIPQTPQPKPGAAPDGIARKAIKPRPAATPISAAVTTPPPAARPVRAALDLVVDPDALLVVPPPRRRWWLTPLLVVCFAGLGGLALYLRFDEWAKTPQIRPVYEWLCPYLGCRLPEMRALDKMVSKNLVVRANPEVAGALLVDAIIVNEAKFAQPFPDIELHFSALDGSPVKTQRYSPDKYLAGELKGIKMIAPMTPVHIALDIEDPGPKAVNYVMGFR
jgi:hypothetical protein